LLGAILDDRGRNFRCGFARLGVTAPLGFLPGICSTRGHFHTPVRWSKRFGRTL